MNTPYITIIIPVFNSEAFLRKCLDSVLSQSYRNFEVLLIDDGSTDGSYSICEEYAIRDKRIMFISQPNRGVSTARNRGLQESTGNWIMFLDSDDMIKEGALQTYVNQIDSSSLDLVVSSMGKYFFHENHEEKFVLDDCLYKGADIARMCLVLKKHFFYGMVCCKLYRSSIIKDNNILFDSTISYHEDELFFTEVLQHCSSAKTIKDITYQYNRFEGTLTHRYVPVDIQLYTSHRIFEESKKISVFTDYQDYVNKEFIENVFAALTSMYLPRYLKYTNMYQRYSICKRIFREVEEENLQNVFFQRLQHDSFVFKSAWGIEVIGLLKCLKCYVEGKR